MPRSKKQAEFVAEALAAEAAVEAGAPLYRAKKVRARLERVARGEKVGRPALIKRRRRGEASIAVPARKLPKLTDDIVRDTLEKTRR